MMPSGSIASGSASAAEVVTGALRDTGRAVVVGERSFGKGSVQSVFKLKNGEGLRLTTARYYTPSGVSIHEKGIAPHVEIVMTPDEDAKLRRQRARSDITDPAQFKERFGFEPIADRQLDTAVAMLKGVRLLSGGTPRLVNVLAHKTLMLAYGEGEHKVRMRHAKIAAADTPAAA